VTRGRIRTEEVLVFLGVERSSGFLESLRREGLFEADDLDPDEADDLRLARVLIEDLGVNPAGVEVALHLRRRLFALERRARVLAGVLEERAAKR
jgi:hypothetical protein